MTLSHRNLASVSGVSLAGWGLPAYFSAAVFPSLSYTALEGLFCP